MAPVAQIKPALVVEAPIKAGRGRIRAENYNPGKIAEPAAFPKRVSEKQHLYKTKRVYFNYN